VINISLAGPPNRLLEAVLARVNQRGIPVLAAAGNAGPASEPLYPAAYESVVAITAVEAGGRVFRLANRGEYLDLAAPGVNIRHADSEGGYRVSSGTSFAVPFASVAVARLRVQHPGGDALSQLYQSAFDLGPPGKDSIYGYGLLNPQPIRQVASYQR
jgi:subtilisin family serine protease